MGFLNLFKKDKHKKKPEHTQPSLQIEWEEVGDIPESDTTEDDTDLPFGWVTHNKEFIEPIEKEFSYFMNIWIDARDKSPRELHSALKSFVGYMESVQKLCRSKGKYFEIWCNEILLSPGYLDARKKELEESSTEWLNLQREYDQKQKLLLTLHDDLWDLIISNDSILQTDIYKHFDNSVKQDIQSLLYNWDKLGKISRIKTGRTYTVVKK